MLSKVFLSAGLAISTSTTASASSSSGVKGFPDRDAPKITDLTYGPSVVPTGSVFTASLTASDPLGVDRVTFSASPPQGWWYPCSDSTLFQLVNGTVYDGTWQVECPIPAGTPSQMYSFTYNCVDTESHNTYETFKNGFDVSGGPTAEYNPPSIEKVTCADTITAGTMLDIHLTIADESGVNSDMSYVKVHQIDGYVVPCSAEDFVLESGSWTDGVFRASCLVPADTPNGDYWLEVHVYDTQKNPAEQHVEDAFTVVNGATPDHIPPSVTNIKYADSTLERGQTLSVTASVSDLDSGVNNVDYQARESYSQDLLCRGPMVLQSGDTTTGVWAFSCEVPADAMIAYYTGSMYAYDNQDNTGMGSASVQIVMPNKV
jgi:hypothetical protein